MPVRVDLPLPPERHDAALELLVALDALDVAPVPGGLGAVLPGDPDDPALGGVLAPLASALGLPPLAATAARARDDGSTWLVAPRPVQVGGVWLVPAGQPSPGAPAVVLGDSDAFGSGRHPTTALCLEALADAEPLGAPVLDVGTGSGVLALAALARGAPRAVGVDLDPAAVAAARDNAARSGLAERFEARVGGPEVVEGRFGLVFANILTGPLLALAPALVRRLDRGGLLVLSGVRAPFADEVARAYRDRGLYPRGRATRGDWVALSFAPSW